MYNPKEYWDSIGNASSVGKDNDAGKFASDPTGRQGYKLPSWSSVPQWWDLVRDMYRILDIGSGNGLQVGRLTERGKLAVGMDISSALLHVAYENCVAHGVTSPSFVQWDGVRLPLMSASFDSVTTNTVFQHVVDDIALKAIVGEASRVLKPGGLFLMSEVVSPRTVQSAAHVKLRSIKTYEELMRRHGLVRKSMDYHASFYVTIQAIYGALKTKRTISADLREAHAAQNTPLPVSRSSVSPLIKQIVLKFAHIADRLIMLAHLERIFAGQASIVFVKQ